jgi:Thiolase, C-terminal domain
MTTLVNALEQSGGRYGLQTMCEGGGMANATSIERLGGAASPPSAMPAGSTEGSRNQLMPA